MTSKIYKCKLRDATLQCFEKVQKLQKYRLLNVPENLNQNSLREPRGLFHMALQKAQQNATAPQFEEAQKLQKYCLLNVPKNFVFSNFLRKPAGVFYLP